MHYVWKHKLFPLAEQKTTDGKSLEIIDTGLHNHNAGPDFFNAKVKIDGTLWVGNVELHDKASDWFRHGHEKNAAYNNVILHVVGQADTEATTADGMHVTQFELKVPPTVADHYRELLQADRFPPCHRLIPQLERLKIHSWMSALQTERLEEKTAAIARKVEQCNGSWEDAFFATLARNYGFGINGEAFESWAMHVPLNCIAHHRDDLFQIEAFFFGQAGLLDTESMTEKQRQQAMADSYFSRLRTEYSFLAHKFSLKPIERKQWRFMRLRPQNFPYIRISQLANLYFSRKAGLGNIMECTTPEQARRILCTEVSEYWQTHYAFGAESAKSQKHLSAASLDLIIINTVVPMLFAYGSYMGNERICNRAFGFLEQLKPEDNTIIRTWKECGMDVQNAGDTQALVQLKKEYCDKKKCLYCRIGYEYLKRRQ